MGKGRKLATAFVVLSTLIPTISALPKEPAINSNKPLTSIVQDADKTKERALARIETLMKEGWASASGKFSKLDINVHMPGKFKASQAVPDAPSGDRSTLGYMLGDEHVNFNTFNRRLVWMEFEDSTVPDKNQMNMLMNYAYLEEAFNKSKSNGVELFMSSSLLVLYASLDMPLPSGPDSLRNCTPDMLFAGFAAYAHVLRTGESPDAFLKLYLKDPNIQSITREDIDFALGPGSHDSIWRASRTSEEWSIRIKAKGPEFTRSFILFMNKWFGVDAALASIGDYRDYKNGYDMLGEYGKP